MKKFIFFIVCATGILLSEDIAEKKCGTRQCEGGSKKCCMTEAGSTFYKLH